MCVRGVCVRASVCLRARGCGCGWAAREAWSGAPRGQRGSVLFTSFPHGGRGQTGTAAGVRLAWLALVSLLSPSPPSLTTRFESRLPSRLPSDTCLRPGAVPPLGATQTGGRTHSCLLGDIYLLRQSLLISLECTTAPRESRGHEGNQRGSWRALRDCDGRVCDIGAYKVPNPLEYVNVAQQSWKPDTSLSA